MPDIDINEINLNDLLRDAFPVNLSKEKEEKAKNEYAEYLVNNDKNINELMPLTVYYIIRDLTDSEIIKFLKDNINYIKDHNNEIFLYAFMSPPSLASFFSYNVLKELYGIDKDIFRKILKEGERSFFGNFSNEEFILFYDEFKDEIITNIEPRKFFSDFSQIRHYHYKNLSKIYDSHVAFKMAKDEDKIIIDFIMKNYCDYCEKEENLLDFLSNALDLGLEENIAEEFIGKNKDRLLKQIKNTDGERIFELFEDLSSHGQRILLRHFLDDVLEKGGYVTKVFHSNVLVELYRNNKDMVNKIDLNSLINRFYLDEDLEEVLSFYDVNSVEEYFKSSTYYRSFAYIENRFRKSIMVNGEFEDIKGKSIASNSYLKNLKELHALFKANKITRNNDLYKEHFKVFFDYLVDINKVSREIDELSFKEIERLFYRVVCGLSITCTVVSGIEGIALLNRKKEIDLVAEEFSVEQLVKYNVKKHEALCELVKDKGNSKKGMRTNTLKLMLLVGYENARYILMLDNSLTTIEHLVGNVYVKNIKMDENGNPILNVKVINLLFKDLKRNRIKLMLEDKESDLYKYFPRIFNEWSNIEINKKNDKLYNVIEYLKGADVTLLPKYYRLEGAFKYIGCSSDIVNETLLLHDLMIKRKNSSIPRIKGEYCDYTYEVLRLDDVYGLTVGNRTNCCFTVKGTSCSALKHACTSEDGRILVIKKDNELVAHSYLWRNGNVLCLDNIEVSKGIKEINFLDVYSCFAKHIIKESNKVEGKQSIGNVTLGVASFDKKIININAYPCFVKKGVKLDTYVTNKLKEYRTVLDSLPMLGEKYKNVYSDAVNVQYLLEGNGEFKYYDAIPVYSDSRRKSIYINDCEDEGIVKKVNSIVNGLRYLKFELENDLSSFEIIDIKNYKEIYCNEDYYVLIDKKGNVEKYILSDEQCVLSEVKEILNNKVKRK